MLVRSELNDLSNRIYSTFVCSYSRYSTCKFRPIKNWLFAIHHSPQEWFTASPVRDVSSFTLVRLTEDGLTILPCTFITSSVESGGSVDKALAVPHSRLWVQIPAPNWSPDCVVIILDEINWKCSIGMTDFSYPAAGRFNRKWFNISISCCCCYKTNRVRKLHLGTPLSRSDMFWL